MNNRWQDRAARSFFPTFSDLPTIEEEGTVVISRGEGIYVLDTDGRRYLEGNSGLWNMTLGFSEPRLVEVARRQYEALPGYHTFFGRNSQPSIELAERLIALAPNPMSRVFFANSGTEANESVAKLLWLMWLAEGEPKRRKFITRKGAYHGSATITTSLTGKDYVKAFGLPLPEIVTVGSPHAWRYAQANESEQDFATRLAVELDKTIQAEGAETIAGMFAEPIMGAGGVIVPPKNYFPQIQAVLRKYRIPLVADEVICGFGRAGALWGSQVVGQAGDIIVASKSISAGYFPMGAVLMSKEIDERVTKACQKWEEFPHGFTTGGHPVGCAISLEAIKIIVEGGVLENVKSVTPLFQKRLKEQTKFSIIAEARGAGLMGALELVADKASKIAFPSEARIGERIASAARKKGLIIRPLGSALVVAPPFIINASEIDELFSILETVLGEV